MVHVLEVLSQQGDVDDFAGDEVRVVEGGGEGFGVGVGADALNALLGSEGYTFVGGKGGLGLGQTSCGTILDLGGA